MSGKDKAKKVLGFLFFRSAFTQRNLTSIGLVLLLFAVYVLAGGKIDAVPKVSPNGGSFGGVEETERVAPLGRAERPPVASDQRTEDAGVGESDGSDPYADIERWLQERKNRRQ